jgi:hypothetical protein
MKTIKVEAVVYDNIRDMYRIAKTPAQRALLGYMAKAGMATDSIFGGAFKMLRGIEWCMEGNVIYSLYPLEDSVTHKKILHVAQLALDGEFDSFAFSAREIENIIKYMNNF